MRQNIIRGKKYIKSVSREAVILLLDEAQENLDKQPERSRRYVRMAFGLIKKHRLRLPREQRLRFCRKCQRYWVPEKTLTIHFEPRRHALRFECACGATRRVIMGRRGLGTAKPLK